MKEEKLFLSAISNLMPGSRRAGEIFFVVENVLSVLIQEVLKISSFWKVSFCPVLCGSNKLPLFLFKTLHNPLITSQHSSRHQNMGTVFLWISKASLHPFSGLTPEGSSLSTWVHLNHFLLIIYNSDIENIFSHPIVKQISKLNVYNHW